MKNLPALMRSEPARAIACWTCIAAVLAGLYAFWELLTDSLMQ